MHSKNKPEGDGRFELLRNCANRCAEMQYLLPLFLTARTRAAHDHRERAERGEKGVVNRNGDRLMDCTPVVRHGNSGTGCFKVGSAIA